MRLAGVVLWLIGSTTLCLAQAGLTLEFDSAAPREVFVASALPNQAPTHATKSGGQTLAYRPTSSGSGDRIYVWDHATNNLASKPLKDIVGKTWDVKSSDYTSIGVFTVHVEHQGQPASAANVTVSSKGKTAQKLLAPSEKGDVRFFGFPAGELRVKVAYVTNAKTDASQEQVFQITMNRDAIEPVFTVAIPAGVATVPETTTPAAPAGAASSGRTGDAGGGSSVGKLILMLVALLVIGGAAYWAFFMFKNKPDQVKDALTKLGVQIPQPPDPNGGAPATVTPLAPAPPPPKIILEDAAPTPLGAHVGPSPTAASAEGGTLVRDTGERSAVPEGESIVGRDVGLGLSLVGESSVSRRHARLTRTGATTVLADLGSTNGTFVNGARLQGEVTLKPGDQIQFGTVRFRFEG